MWCKDVTEGIKVVDFGNAIHCIFNELALYYNDFHLQTLLYRAPEVAFGLPFGPEVDIWSVGCILAELYIGEPLFPAKDKEFLLTRMVGLLGPLPCTPFNRGKFHNEMRGFTGKPQPPHVTVNKIRHYLGDLTDYNFATFLFGMLKYDPAERMSVSAAFQHPFVAPEVAGRFLLPVLSTSSTYSTLHLDPTLYSKSPEVSADIAKECLSGVGLLRRGTFRRAVAEVSPFLPKRKSASLKVCPQTARTSTTQYSQTGKQDKNVILGTAVDLKTSRTGGKSHVNRDGFDFHIHSGAYSSIHRDAVDPDIHSGISDSHIHRDAVYHYAHSGVSDSCIHSNTVDPDVHSASDSHIHRDAVDPHVHSASASGIHIDLSICGGASDSHVHSDVFNSDNNSSASDSGNHSNVIDAHVHSGAIDSCNDNSSFVADYKEFHNEGLHISNKECNKGWMEDNQNTDVLFINSENQCVKHLEEPAIQQNVNPSRGGYRKRKACSYIHSSSSPPAIEHTLPLRKESGFDVTPKQTLNSQTYTQCMALSDAIQSKNPKKKSAERTLQSLSRLKKQTEKKSQRPRKVFEHFNKARRIALKRGVDGFKELQEEEDSKDKQEKTEDPYDIDRMFNEVQTPVKSFHGERTKFKPNTSKSRKNLYRSSLQIKDEKRLKMKDKKSDISRKMSAPSNVMYNNFFGIDIKKSDYSVTHTKENKAASKLKNEVLMKSKTEEKKNECSKDILSVGGNGCEGYQSSSCFKDIDSEVHIEKTVENCDSKYNSDSIEQDNDTIHVRRELIEKDTDRKKDLHLPVFRFREHHISVAEHNDEKSFNYVSVEKIEDETFQNNCVKEEDLQLLSDQEEDEVLLL
ncbi:uncharacterized protein LOC117111618 [Anneissia japonica]|uniref:uncharacterized protein LOC117111618 n=1 Tax=Anneissia japonica TaxID=1529436 RepID=UPI0014257488|nr:uncharacterized protein LOC117111618 [Anneissia japonica]